MIRKVIKLSSILLIGSLFAASCNRLPADETVYSDPNVYAEREGAAPLAEEIREARENLDLQAVAALLERARDAEEFERLLNSEDGVNNLDLNDDGYADYISVAEFEDRTDGERGLSLFSRFGPELIQEIATIVFDRDRADRPGARVLLAGDEDLYGDNHYYETNWLDRSLALVNHLFGDRDEFYESPYDYENQPSGYTAYRVVETPLYRSRVERYYPAPAFVYTNAPSIPDIRISSPYRDLPDEKVFVRKAKLSRQEKERWEERGPNRPETVPVRRGWSKDDKPKNDKERKEWKKEAKEFEREQRKFDNKPAKFEKPDKKEFARGPKPEKAEKRDMKPPKPEKNGKQNGGDWKQKGNGNGDKGGKGGGNKGGGNGNKGGKGKG